MRGKSLTPVSRMEMDESSSCMLDRRDDTHPSREFAMASDPEVYAAGYVVMRGGWTVESFAVLIFWRMLVVFTSRSCGGRRSPPPVKAARSRPKAAWPFSLRARVLGTRAPTSTSSPADPAKVKPVHPPTLS